MASGEKAARSLRSPANGGEALLKSPTFQDLFFFLRLLSKFLSCVGLFFFKKGCVYVLESNKLQYYYFETASHRPS